MSEGSKWTLNASSMKVYTQFMYTPFGWIYSFNSGYLENETKREGMQ